MVCLNVGACLRIFVCVCVSVCARKRNFVLMARSVQKVLATFLLVLVTLAVVVVSVLYVALLEENCFQEQIQIAKNSNKITNYYQF